MDSKSKFERFRKITTIVSEFLDICAALLSKIWYIIVLLPTLIYTVKNWDSCKNFETISGDNIIFIFLLLLLLLPFFRQVKINALGGGVEATMFNITDDAKQKVLAEMKSDSKRASFDSIGRENNDKNESGNFEKLKQQLEVQYKEVINSSNQEGK